MVTFARAHSGYYCELSQGLPEWIEDPALLPVTDKKRLMASFDDWVTDCSVTYQGVSAFVDDPSLIGERFLGRYLANITSGSTGTRGIFLLDDSSTAAGTAVSLCMFLAVFDAADAIRLLAWAGAPRPWLRLAATSAAHPD